MPESYVLQQLVFPQHQDKDILGKQRDSNVSSMSLQCAQVERGPCSVDSAGTLLLKQDRVPAAGLTHKASTILLANQLEQPLYLFTLSFAKTKSPCSSRCGDHRQEVRAIWPASQVKVTRMSNFPRDLVVAGEMGSLPTHCFSGPLPW